MDLSNYSGPRVIINPQVMKDDRDALCVAFNESFRIIQEINGFDPVAEPTEKQRAFFADTAYRDDERMLRRTILSRICTFDTSVTDPTDEQLQEAVEFLDTVLEIGAPQNQWEQRAVERIRTAISKALESGERVPASQAPAPEGSPEVAAGGAGSSAGGVPEDEEKDSGARPNGETQAAFDAGKAGSFKDEFYSYDDETRKQLGLDKLSGGEWVENDNRIIFDDPNDSSAQVSMFRTDSGHALMQYRKMQDDGSYGDWTYFAPGSDDASGVIIGHDGNRFVAPSPGQDSHFYHLGDMAKEAARESEINAHDKQGTDWLRAVLGDRNNGLYSSDLQKALGISMTDSSSPGFVDASTMEAGWSSFPIRGETLRPDGYTDIRLHSKESKNGDYFTLTGGKASGYTRTNHWGRDGAKMSTASFVNGNTTYSIRTGESEWKDGVSKEEYDAFNASRGTFGGFKRSAYVDGKWQPTVKSVDDSDTLPEVMSQAPEPQPMAPAVQEKPPVQQVAAQQPVQQAVVTPQQETLTPGLSSNGSRSNILELNGRRISQREFDRIQAEFRDGGGAQPPRTASERTGTTSGVKTQGGRELTAGEAAWQARKQASTAAWMQRTGRSGDGVADAIAQRDELANNLRQSTQVDSGRRDALGRKLDDRGRVIV